MNGTTKEEPYGITRLVTLNSVPTKIIVYDRDSKWTTNNYFQYDRLVLMITGNPGEIEYYRHFLSSIHRQTNLPVVGVSNSGHNRLPKNVSQPDVNKNPILYNLEAQIRNKVSFITDHIHPETRLVLVGHSIACYIILELLENPKISSMVEHCVLIFPTIDSMAQTKQGILVTRLFTTFYYPLLILTYLLDNFLSQESKQKLIKYVLNRKPNPNPIPQCVIESATALLNPNCVKAVALMTLEEFRDVQTPKFDIIKKNISRLTVLYGEADHWCPVEFYHKMKDQCGPESDIRLCLGSIDHAFVIDPVGTDFIANLTVEMVRKVFNR